MFTGNDYISSFFTKRKTASWKKMVKDEKYIQGFQEFGMSLEITREILEVLEEFVCKMYGFNCASVNKLYHISSIDAPQFTEFCWDSESKPIWVDEMFPDDIKELLMLDSEAKLCDEVTATNIKRWTKVKMIFKKKVTIMILKMAERKIVTMIVTFFEIKSFIKSKGV